MKMGPIACSETSETNYNYMLRKIPEERKSRFHRSGSLKSSKKEENKKGRKLCGQQLENHRNTRIHSQETRFCLTRLQL
jgi:hypothetical protein